jgi:hypothetical protein
VFCQLLFGILPGGSVLLAAAGNHAATAKTRTIRIPGNFICSAQNFAVSVSIAVWEARATRKHKGEILTRQAGEVPFRRTGCREEIENDGERTAERGAPELPRASAGCVCWVKTSISLTAKLAETRPLVIPWESCETLQQSGPACGSKGTSRPRGALGGLLTGAADAAQRGRFRHGGRTTTAARECMPEHAFAGWLTDQPSSVRIKNTPRDRLAITGKIMAGELGQWL